MENFNDKNYCLRIARRVHPGIASHDGDTVTEKGFALVKDCTDLQINFTDKGNCDAAFIFSCTWQHLAYPKSMGHYSKPFADDGPYTKTFPEVRVIVKESIPENLDEILSDLNNYDRANTILVKQKPFGRTYIVDGIVSNASRRGIHIIYAEVLEMMKDHMKDRYKWFDNVVVSQL
jgi:hypothetical protein